MGNLLLARRGKLVFLLVRQASTLNISEGVESSGGSSSQKGVEQKQWGLGKLFTSVPEIKLEVAVPAL